jgi:glutathione synthase/RimK-type ligase-like ATP-grasp enzyme
MAFVPDIAIFYEHPDWFKPLFGALTARGVPYVAQHADGHRFTPGEAWDGPEPAIVFNRMSPSAWKRGRATAIPYTAEYLRHLESHGLAVVNGAAAYALEVSKVAQVALLTRLGLPVPRTVVARDAHGIIAAAAQLEAPFVVKPNIGGSGAGIVRFDSHAELRDRVAAGEELASLDGVLLAQEFHAPRGQSIYRVETLDAQLLYGIRVEIGDGAGFNLCPADICKSTGGAELSSAACPVGAQIKGLTVEHTQVPDLIARQVAAIARAAQIDVGGVEYLHSERDGQLYFYDVNALSNFVADPLKVVGFDPTAKLVDSLLSRVQARRGA